MPLWRRRQPAAAVAPGLAAVVRGGWVGFVVLFLGDLATLYHGRGSGLVLYWVAAAAYAVAGNRAARPSGTDGRTAARDGAGAALFAYALTLPLRLAAGRVPGGAAGLTLVGTVVAGVAAVVVGAAAGSLAARAARRRPPPAAGAGPAAGAAVRVGPAGPPAVVSARPSAEPRWPVVRSEVVLPGGRRLQYVSAGPEGAPPLVLHHATPGAVGAWRGAVAAATAAGLRIVVASRPGYGASSPMPGRSVADTAEDVAALLDHLGADRCVALGWGAGGPHALACAALLPDRCAAAAVVAGVAPRDAAGLAWAAGMAADTAAEYELAVAAPAELEVALRDVAASLATVTPDRLAGGEAGALAEADERVLAGPFADYLAATYRAGLAGGVEGWRDDDLAVVGPWGFDLAAVAVPVEVWWGEEDPVVPPAHGRWLASAMPLARGTGRPGEGHLSVLPGCFEEVVAALAPAVAGSGHRPRS